MTTRSTFVMTAFVPFMYIDGIESKLTEGYRLSVIRWKTPKDQKENASYQKRPVVAVMVPVVSLSVTPECLKAAMTDAIAEMQDAAIRSYVAAAIEANSGVNIATIKIPENVGTPAGLAAFAAAEAASKRLSKESLSAWFDGMLSDRLLDVIVSNLPEGTENLEEVAASQVVKAREAIISLASPRKVFPPMVAKQLLKAVSMVPEGNATRKQLVEKLDLFANPPSTEELLLNLGID